MTLKEQILEALEAVKRNSYTLYYVKEQTSEICSAAVKQNKWFQMRAYEKVEHKNLFHGSMTKNFSIRKRNLKNIF